MATTSLFLRSSYQTVLSLYSQVLGLDLRLKAEQWRFFDPASGQTLFTHQEDKVRADEAEARIAELEARLRALTDFGED